MNGGKDKQMRGDMRTNINWEKIRSLAKDKGYTLSSLSRRIGHETNYLSSAMNRGSLPKSKIDLISFFLDARADDLLVNETKAGHVENDEETRSIEQAIQELKERQEAIHKEQVAMKEALGQMLNSQRLAENRLGILVNKMMPR